MTRPFDKYRRRGAYHWEALERNPRRHNAFLAARYRAVLDAAQPAPAESVLDLGCGDGALAYLVWRRLRKGTLIGVEPDDTGRGLAEAMFRRHGARAHFVPSSCAIADGSQDVVICAEVIEHVEDPDALLGEIRRLLRPGGRAVLSTPIRLTERPWDREHVREFFPDEFRRCVTTHLRVVRHVPVCSVFALGLYEWRPRFLLRRGLTRVAINVLSAWCGVPVMRDLNPTGRFYMIQVLTGVKE